MLPGSISESEVSRWETTATVNGVPRRMASWSATGELSGDLPQSVAAGNGLTQSSGQVVWAPQKTVLGRPAHPFRAGSGWTPEPGDRIQIVTKDTVTGDEFPQFSGFIDRTGGSPRAGMTSTLIDPIDTLSVPFSYPCVNRIMPPLVDGDLFRHVGTNPMQVISAAAAAAGYRAVAHPDNVAEMLVDVPMHGSMWPQVGTISASPSEPLPRRDSGWGYSTRDFDASYLPAGTVWGHAAIQIMMSSAANAEHGASVYVRYGSEVLQLRISDAHVAEIRHNNTVIVSRPMGDGVLAIATIDGDAGIFRLWTDNGGAPTSQTSTPVVNNQMTRIDIAGGIGASVSGVTVCRPNNPAVFPSAFTRNFNVDVSSHFMSTSVTIRAIESAKAIDVLREICAALLLVMYFDEEGNLTIKSSDLIAGASPVAVLTTRDDILDIKWETSFLSHRSRVDVTRDLPDRSINRYRNKILAQGSGETLENGDSTTIIFSPGADEEWIVIDEPVLAGSATQAVINSGRGSLMGASATNDTDSVWGNAYISRTYERISEKAHKFTFTAHSVPAGRTGSLSTANEGTSTLWPKYKDFSLPILRGSKIQFTEETLTYPAGAVGGTLVHETKHWTGEFLVAGRIAEHLVEHVTAPRPVITDCPVRFDPRRQKGDVVTIESRKYLGVIINAVVMGVTSSGSRRDGHKQSLTVRVIGIETTIQSFAEWNEMGPDGLTLAQFNALAPTPLTLNEFNADMEA